MEKVKRDQYQYRYVTTVDQHIYVICGGQVHRGTPASSRFAQAPDVPTSSIVDFIRGIVGHPRICDTFNILSTAPSQSRTRARRSIPLHDTHSTPPSFPSSLLLLFALHPLANTEIQPSMPLPPRPIHIRQHPRPGTSVPRKSTLAVDDWRAELPLAPGQGPRSLPSAGVQVVTKSVAEGMRTTQGSLIRPAMEVDVGMLVHDGKGRREKRGAWSVLEEASGLTGAATTATTLGFDFIANPSVLNIPETTRHLTKLSSTPQTPALVAGSSPMSLPVEDEEWEHIPAYDDDAGIIILGEMEMEDEAVPVTAIKRDGISYAAAAGKKT